MKTCNTCKEVKEKSEFYNCSQSKDGKQGRCRSCKKVNDTKWKKENPDAAKAIIRRRLAKKFDITVAEWDQLLVDQDHKCKICDTHEDDLSRKLAVDHCHTTGKVRGLLCLSCNVALGHFKDDINLLRKAEDYLK